MNLISAKSDFCTLQGGEKRFLSQIGYVFELNFSETDTPEWNIHRY